MDKKRLEEQCNLFLDETMNLNDLPGLAIGVSVGSKSLSGAAADCPTEFIGVRGYRDYAAKTPLEEDDIFHCASVSKLFTSSAIMKLVEEGALDPDDKLCDLLPLLLIADRRYEDIRLRDMLTHTSGLGDVSDYHWYDFETDEKSLWRYVYESEEVVLQPMLWEPGEDKFRYSNIAYEILGQIVSEYSNQMTDRDIDESSEEKISYEDFVARYLLEPAGMHSSTMKTFERPGAPDFTGKGNTPGMARPHEKKSDRSIELVKCYPYTRQHAPSSTLTSNVHDLLRWGKAHLQSAGASAFASENDVSGTLLKTETYEQIWQPYATVPNNGEKMGLGWFMREQVIETKDNKKRAFQLMGHEGTDDGFRASFWICPELDMVTVVLSNLSGAPVKRINKQLFERIVRSCIL